MGFTPIIRGVVFTTVLFSTQFAFGQDYILRRGNTFLHYTAAERLYEQSLLAEDTNMFQFRKDFFQALARSNRNFNMITFYRHGPDQRAVDKIFRNYGRKLRSSHLLLDLSCADPHSDGFYISSRFNGTVVATRPGFTACSARTNFGRNTIFFEEADIDGVPGARVDAGDALGVFRNGELTHTRILHPERLITRDFYIRNAAGKLIRGTRKSIPAKPRIDWNARFARQRRISTLGNFLISGAITTTSGFVGHHASQYLGLPSWTEPAGYVGGIYAGALFESIMLGGVFSSASMVGLATAVPVLAYDSYTDALRRLDEAEREVSMAASYAMTHGHADNMYYVADGERRFIPSALRTTWYCHSEAIQSYCSYLEDSFKTEVARYQQEQARLDFIRSLKSSRTSEPLGEVTPEALRLQNDLLQWAR